MGEDDVLIPRISLLLQQLASHVAQCQRNSLPAGDTDSIPGSERAPGGGDGNLLQYSSLGNSLDRGTWKTTVQANYSP